MRRSISNAKAAGVEPKAKPNAIEFALRAPARQTSQVARQEGLEPPTHSLEGCRSIQLSYWRNGRTGALSAERH